MHVLEAWAHDLSPDIIGMSETWATSDILDAELALPGYSLFTRRFTLDIDSRKYVFSNRVVDNWNSLSAHSIDSSTIYTFKMQNFNAYFI